MPLNVGGALLSLLLTGYKVLQFRISEELKEFILIILWIVIPGEAEVTSSTFSVSHSCSLIVI